MSNRFKLPRPVGPNRHTRRVRAAMDRGGPDPSRSRRTYPIEPSESLPHPGLVVFDVQPDWSVRWEYHATIDGRDVLVGTGVCPPCPNPTGRKLCNCTDSFCERRQHFQVRQRTRAFTSGVPQHAHASLMGKVYSATEVRAVGEEEVIEDVWRWALGWERFDTQEELLLVAAGEAPDRATAVAQLEQAINDQLPGEDIWIDLKTGAWGV